MPFDEQLQRAFDTLTDRLRDELARQLDEVAGHLMETAAAERDQARRAALADHEQALAALTAGHQQALETAVAEAAREAQAVAERDVSVRIANATAVAESRGRERASAEAARRIAELEAALHDAEQRARAAQDESRGAVEQAAAAARTQADGGDADMFERLLAGIREIDAAQSLTGVLDALVAAAGREMPRAGILLARGGQFHTWRFAGFDDHFDQSQSFDVRYPDAGVISDALSRREMVIADGASAPRFAALAADHTAIAVPLALAGEVVAVLYADAGDRSIADRGLPRRLELLGRHASAALETITAFKTARALVDNPPSPAPSSHVSEGPDEAARRYARLLVSEIKLYHEADVLAGRRERNIASRLAGEIERARTLYEQRVPAPTRGAHDYFHAELVRTLASGDPSLLGEVKA